MKLQRWAWRQEELTRERLCAVAMECRDPMFGEWGRIDTVLDSCMAAPAAWCGVMTVHDHPVIAAGLWPIWPGRAQAWMLVSERARMRDIYIAMQLASYELSALQRQFPALHRIEMWVAADAPWRERFASELGMRQEGFARNWGPAGDDHVLYARIAGRTA